MNPTPTPREIAVMTKWQAEQKAALSQYEECYVCGRPMDGLSEDDCHCFHFKQLRPVAANPPSPRAGDSIEGEPK